MDDVVFSSEPAVISVLIPEMNFICNGTIIGFTFAGIMKNGDQNPMIQIWRESCSQPGVYYRTGADIMINEVLCEGGFTEVFAGVFHCNLTETAQQPVQPGDILGLELAPERNSATNLSFTRVIKGPINYVFNEEQLSSPMTVILSNRDSGNQKLTTSNIQNHRFVIHESKKCCIHNIKPKAYYIFLY